MDQNNIIASRIKSLREEKQVLLKYVAESIGLSPAAYSRIESGQTQITIANLYKIAVVLETPVEQMLNIKGSSEFHNKNSIVYQQGINHTLHFYITPEQFSQIETLLKKD